MTTRTEDRAVAEMVVHPASRRIFGHLSPDEFEDLKRDIQARGLKHPLELDSSGRVVCGGERLRALQELRVPRTLVLVHDHLVVEEDCVEELVMDNLVRRHLTPSQRYRAGRELEEIEGVRAKRRKMGGRAVPAHEKGETEAHVASKLHVGSTSYQRLKAIFEHGSAEVRDKVDRGELSLHAAATMVRKASGRQQARAVKLAGDDPRTVTLRLLRLKHDVAQVVKFLEAHSLADFGASQDEVGSEVEGLAAAARRFLVDADRPRATAAC